MHNIKASVMLAKYITEDNIEGIVKTLPGGEENKIWMILLLKTNVKAHEEIVLGFDIIGLGDNADFCLELGEFTFSKSTDTNNKSVYPLKDTFSLGQELPPLPVLQAGIYEFIVYEKDIDQNYILDTYQFAVN